FKEINWFFISKMLGVAVHGEGYAHSFGRHLGGRFHILNVKKLLWHNAAVAQGLVGKQAGCLVGILENEKFISQFPEIQPAPRIARQHDGFFTGRMSEGEGGYQSVLVNREESQLFRL